MLATELRIVYKTYRYDAGSGGERRPGRSDPWWGAGRAERVTPGGCGRVRGVASGVSRGGAEEAAGRMFIKKCVEDCAFAEGRASGGCALVLR